MRDSYTLAITEITETGLKSEGSLADEDFGTGVTFASFHSAGVWPLTIQSLKNLVMLGEITAAQF